MLHASIRQFAQNRVFAALVLEIDTIPKPDGLGKGIRVEDSEQWSNNFG